MIRSMIIVFLVSALSANSQSILSYGEIYDFEIGDEFHYYKEIGSYGDVYIKWIERFTINDKFYSIDSSEVFYARTGTHTELYNRNGIISTYSIDDTLVYKDLDSLVSVSFDIDTIIQDPQFYNGQLQYVSFDYRYAADNHFDSSRYTFIPGLGKQFRYSWLNPDPFGSLQEQTLLY